MFPCEIEGVYDEISEGNDEYFFFFGKVGILFYWSSVPYLKREDWSIFSSKVLCGWFAFGRRGKRSKDNNLILFYFFLSKVECFL